MSSQSSLAGSRRSHLAVVLAAYLLAYFIASFLDLSTTSLALQGSGAHEGNVFATNAQAYRSSKAWVITLAGGLVMAGCVGFGFRNAPRVEEVWLRHPVRSFGLFYLNPWASAAIGRSPIHMLSVAIAFAALRVMAAANNLMIYFCGFAPIGAPIEWISRRSSAAVGFVAVLVPLFYLLAIAVSPAAAKLVSSWRNSSR
jgi:hypothetical protein